MSETNEYSPTWFKVFLDGFPAERTRLQVDFLQRHCPKTVFPRVLDVCSGSGRVAGPLSAEGYAVTAIDLNPVAVRTGAARWPAATFVEGDMRDMTMHEGQFDVVLCLWQSFGFFDEVTNARVLSGMARCLRHGGRLILDLYHRGSLASLPGSQVRQMAGMDVTTTSHLHGRRFRVDLSYSTGGSDAFDWEVFVPAEMEQVAASVGLATRLVCSRYDERVAASSSEQSFQIIFEKP